MRISLWLLLAAAATICVGTQPVHNGGGKAPTAGSTANSVNAPIPPVTRDVSIDDGAIPELAHDLTDVKGLSPDALSRDGLNTTDRRSTRPARYHSAYIKRNPRVYVRIYFAIDDHGYMYINYGRRHPRRRHELIRQVQRIRNWKQTKVWRGWLNVGAVIGFRAINLGGPGGLIATIDVRVKGKWYRHNTGHYPVRLHTFQPRSRSTSWMHMNRRPCRWHKALGRYVHGRRLAKTFPYKTKAKYVWPWRSRYRGKGRRRRRYVSYHKGHVIFRYKLGGECGYRPPGIPRPVPAPRPHMRLVTINFASDNIGYLFINGRVVRTVKHWHHTTTYRAWLPKGTVIAFQTTNSGGPGGIIASILIQRGRYKRRLNTGQYRFRVHTKSRSKHFLRVWKSPKYKACSWPRATRAYTHKLRISKRFPYKTGAKYIWFPRKYTHRGTMLMRYRIGGERCHPPPRRHYRLVTINFASDNIGYLFINGRVVRTLKHWHHTTTYRAWLRVGTAIGFQTTNTAGAGGMIASILIQHGRHKRRLNTGRYRFRVHTGSRSKHFLRVWKSPKYKTCGWPRATRAYTHKLRISKRFPYKTGAKYIWFPRKYTHRGTMLMRYKVGGERCDPAPRRHYRLVTINFASDNIGYLYINGRRRRVVKSWATSTTYRAWLRLGTTIGIEAKNHGGAGGIIASILVQHGRRKYRMNTGRFPFRVHLKWKNPRHRRLNHIWKFPVYKTCAWPRATGPYVHNRRISRTFPYKLGAKYVWAPGKPNFVGTLFLRFRLGGELCKRPPPPPPRPGRGCPCRKSTNPNRGQCFKFIGKEPTGNRSGLCRAKDCEVKYECTSRARAKGRCITKYATDEVRVVGRRGRLTCRRVRLAKRRPFLVPYSG